MKGLRRNYSTGTRIHKGNVNFGMGLGKCKKIIIEGNMARLWENVTCKNCLKYRKDERTEQ